MRGIYLVITPYFPSSTSFRGSFIFDQVNAIRKTNKFDLVIFKPTPFFSKINDYFPSFGQYICVTIGTISNTKKEPVNKKSSLFLREER